MCLTIPAKILKVNNLIAEIDKDGQKITISTALVPKVKKGDWILYISDYALKVISDKDASEILELLEQKPLVRPKNLDPKFEKILTKSRVTGKLSREEIIYLLNSEGNEKTVLLSEADLIRKAHLKDFVCVHAILEFSNYCKNDCTYCGIRCQNKKLKRYRMSVDEIVKVTVAASKKGYKLVVLQSGEDPYYTTEMLAEIITKIKEKTKIFIFLSIGERDFETYRALREAGTNGVLFRFETTNPRLFKKLHPDGKSYEKRFEHLKFLKKLGYYIATGSIVGLPDQKVEDLADDILTTKKWSNMVTIGPFVPTTGTPLGKDLAGSVDMTLKMIAIFRLLNKKIRIPATTALETLDPHGRQKALSCGANSMMLAITPKNYRPFYNIYDNKYFENESQWEKYGLFKLENSYRMLEEKMAAEIEKPS